jgi:hypothetical protein
MEKIDSDALAHHRRMKDLRAAKPQIKELTKGQHMIKRKQEARIQHAEKLAKEEAYRVSAQAGKDYLRLLATNDEDSSSSDDGDFNSSSSEDIISEDDEDNEHMAAARAAAVAAGVSGRRDNGKRNRGGSSSSTSSTADAKASASRWFSNPAFAATIPEMTMTTEEEMAGKILNDANSDDEGEGDLSHLKLDIGVMPKTDKQKRHDKRKKEEQRKERKERRRENKSKSTFADPNHSLGMEEVRGEQSDEDAEFFQKEQVHISDEHRDMIKAGMGNALDESQSTEFETVSANDDDSSKRKRDTTGWSSSDSDGDDSEEDIENSVDPRPNKIGDVEEGYSSDDEMRAHTLAMGTLMAFSHARAKELIDASYNRYSFTDTDLPEWFAEDEQEHNRPQMPVTKEMVKAAKQRFIDLAAAPIKKVAEARARKKMRLAKAVEKAKKLANRIAEDTDMSTRSKMRAIEKAMSKSRVQKTGSVTVKVTKSNGARSRLRGKAKGVKVKFADKRMRSDQRGMDRAAGKNKNKRRKGGGKGKHRSRHFN